MVKPQNVIDTEFVSIWLENEVIHVIWKGTTISMGMAQSAVKLRLQLCEKNSYPLYVDVRSIIRVDFKTRNFLSGVEGISQATAAALHIKNPVTKFLGQVFISINNPLRPTALFTDKQKALEWLEEFK